MPKINNQCLWPVIDDEIDLTYLFKDALSQIDGVMVFNFSDPSL